MSAKARLAKNNSYPTKALISNIPVSQIYYLHNDRDFVLVTYW